jgi:hypothetical protein
MKTRNKTRIIKQKKLRSTERKIIIKKKKKQGENLEKTSIKKTNTKQTR